MSETVTQLGRDYPSPEPLDVDQPATAVAGDVALGWVLTLADAATGGLDLTLEETYPSFEAAAAALLLQHLSAFAHPVQLTPLAPDRWLMKHLDEREQPVDVVHIHPCSASDLATSAA